MRFFRNILALTPCGKPQATFIAHVTALLPWLPGRVHFTGLAYYGGRSARTPARGFARPFPCARLAVAALGAVPPRSVWELPVLDAGLVSKSGRGTWGAGWFRAGGRGCGGGRCPSPLCPAVPGCRPIAPADLRVGHGPGDGRRRGPGPAAGGGRGRGPREPQGARGGRAGAGPARGGAVAQGRGPALSLHRSLRTAACTTRADEQIDLSHAEPAWPGRLQVVYVLPHGADLQTREGLRLYSSDTERALERLVRFYGARVQIEFAFRDTKPPLGLKDCQARAQAQRHFHFNSVFAALFRVRLATDQPPGPFSLHPRKRRHLEEAIRQRLAARSATGRNAAPSGAGRRRIPPQPLWRPPPPLETKPAGP